ncbi:hypothetical protein [Luteipulveratus halotolerans]|uniref:hypothetical protein n=1 Tax=Luteipulveratus halotolerans TaxID=1631356 RepID=UPI00067FC884|nr:hypothetical protein [Luteipulveratus halotolerans]
MSTWWAQKLIVEYEQARGVRGAGARPDGTFSGGASKRVGAPVAELFRAVTEASERERWLPGVQLTERTATAGRSARYDVSDGSRIAFTMRALGDDRAEIAAEHERLPDAEAAAHACQAWKDRLATLKAVVES